MDKLKKLVDLVKENLKWSKAYWDRSHQYSENYTYSEQEINEAFNYWNWSERDLKDFIRELQKNEKPKDMTDKDKEFTRITHESSYGVKTVIDFNSEDVGAEDYIQAMVTIMTSATFTPITIFKTMYEYAKNALDALEHDEEE